MDGVYILNSYSNSTVLYSEKTVLIVFLFVSSLYCIIIHQLIHFSSQMYCNVIGMGLSFLHSDRLQGYLILKKKEKILLLIGDWTDDYQRIIIIILENQRIRELYSLFTTTSCLSIPFHFLDLISFFFILIFERS